MVPPRYSGTLSFNISNWVAPTMYTLSGQLPCSISLPGSLMSLRALTRDAELSYCRLEKAVDMDGPAKLEVNTGPFGPWNTRKRTANVSRANLAFFVVRPART